MLVNSKWRLVLFHWPPSEINNRLLEFPLPLCVISLSLRWITYALPYHSTMLASDFPSTISIRIVCVVARLPDTQIITVEVLSIIQTTYVTIFLHKTRNAYMRALYEDYDIASCCWPLEGRLLSKGFVYVFIFAHIHGCDFLHFTIVNSRQALREPVVSYNAAR